MAQDFTQPDPLRAGVKTLSIYITELQDCVNTKREEIGQVATIFISQKVDKTMSLTAIEELKTRVNTLAIDFGFSGGVTNSSLLGRPYVNHPKVGGNPAAGFPIINDLRRVLNLLISQELDIIHFIGDFVDISGNLYAHYKKDEDGKIISNPWEIEPDLYVPSWNKVMLFVTDKTIIWEDRSPNPNEIYEGVLGDTSPVFLGTIDGPTGVGTLSKRYNQMEADELYFYSILTQAGNDEVWRARRDLSEPLEKFADLPIDIGSSAKLIATSDELYTFAVGRFVRTNKETGATIANVPIPDLSTTPLDLENVGGPYEGLTTQLSGPVEHGGLLYYMYGEFWHNGGFPNRTYHLASGIVKLNINGTFDSSFVHDKDSKTETFDVTFFGASASYKHNGQTLVPGINTISTIRNLHIGNPDIEDNLVFYYRTRTIGSFLVHGAANIPPNAGDAREVHSVDIPLSTEDWLGRDLWPNGGTFPFTGGVTPNTGGSAPWRMAFSENYLDHAELTAVTPVISPISVSRFNAGATDSVNITWDRNDGVLSYDLQRRLLPAGSFVTTNQVLSSAFGIGDIYNFDIPGLIIGEGYEVRIVAVTAHGSQDGIVFTV